VSSQRASWETPEVVDDEVAVVIERERADMIAALVADTDPEKHTVDFSDMSGRTVGPGFVLLTYVTQVEGRRARRSSLWRQSMNGWRVLHHQGTPIP
jgi:hypothetical protein